MVQSNVKLTTRKKLYLLSLRASTAAVSVSATPLSIGATTGATGATDGKAHGTSAP